MRKRRRDEKRGGVAQLGEHLPCKQGVMGSNPIISTKTQKTRQANIGERTDETDCSSHGGKAILAP